MRVLILSCDTGGGHNSCAKAIQTAFLDEGHICDIADSLSFVSKKISQFMAWGHSTMYRHIPGLFRFGYGFAEKHPGALRDGSAVYKLLTGGTERLLEYLLDGKYDTVICAHVFSSIIVSHLLKNHPISLNTAFVATDYTCSPGAVNEGLDCFFIPTALQKEDFMRCGALENKLIPSGIPVRKDFYVRVNKETAKEQFGVHPDHVHLLMMCGSMGCGPMQELTKLLSQSMDHTMELSVACGSNLALQQKLEKEFNRFPNIHIYGFVKDMSGLMASSDLYLTKPGGLSTTEAAVKQLPMVLIDAVAGCEAHNLRYFTEISGAKTQRSPQELTNLCLELLKSEPRRKQMSDALNAISSQNAAACICQTLCANRKEGVR